MADSVVPGHGGGLEEGKERGGGGGSIPLPSSSWGGAERWGDESGRRRAGTLAAAVLQGQGRARGGGGARGGGELRGGATYRPGEAVEMERGGGGGRRATRAPLMVFGRL